MFEVRPRDGSEEAPEVSRGWCADRVLAVVITIELWSTMTPQVAILLIVVVLVQFAVAFVVWLIRDLPVSSRKRRDKQVEMVRKEIQYRERRRKEQRALASQLDDILIDSWKESHDNIS